MIGLDTFPTLVVDFTRQSEAPTILCVSPSLESSELISVLLWPRMKAGACQGGYYSLAGRPLNISMQWPAPRA